MSYLNEIYNLWEEGRTSQAILRLILPFVVVSILFIVFQIVMIFILKIVMPVFLVLLIIHYFNKRDKQQ